MELYNDQVILSHNQQYLGMSHFIIIFFIVDVSFMAFQKDLYFRAPKLCVQPSRAAHSLVRMILHSPFTSTNDSKDELLYISLHMNQPITSNRRC